MLQKHVQNRVKTPLKDVSDAALISDIINGNHRAFAELMSRYKGPLYRFILRYVGSPPDAEDLLQDTFTKVFTKAANYDPAWKVSTWIYRIALNTCRDHGRKQRLRKFVSIDKLNGEEDGDYIRELADLGPDVEHLVIHRQAFRQVSKYINDLPHKMRSALVLYAIEGRSQTECSEILGISRKSVEMLVYRARKRLTNEMNL